MSLSQRNLCEIFKETQMSNLYGSTKVLNNT